MTEHVGHLPLAFALGVDIEEVYAIFGEAIQLALRGLSPAHYDLVERKAQRVRDALLNIGCPAALIQRLDEAMVSKLYRAGDARAANLDRLKDESAQTARAISALMTEVRSHLSPEEASLYDLGVMLARLHLCLRVICGGESSWRSDYAKELQRVVPVVSRFLAAAEQVVAGAEPDQFSKRLGSLAEKIASWDGGSDRWCEATLKRVDGVFEAGGFSLSKVLPAARRGSTPWSEPGAHPPVQPEGKEAPARPATRAPIRSLSSPVDKSFPEDRTELVSAVTTALREARQRMKNVFRRATFRPPQKHDGS